MLCTQSHEARHLLLGDGDFFTAPLGEREVGNFEVPLGL